MKKSPMCVLCKCFANVIPLLQLKITGNGILPDRRALAAKALFPIVNGHNERQAQRKFQGEEILLALDSKEYTASTRRISANPKFPVMRVRNTLQTSCIRTIPSILGILKLWTWVAG